MATQEHLAEVNWSTVAVVGVGLIGGSLALALKRAGLARRVIGVSRAETIRTARELGIIDESGGYEELPRLIEPAHVIFLCTPIYRIIELLPDVTRAARPGTIISDVGSTKAQIVRAAQEVMRPGIVFIGGHPMAGSEQRGVQAADPFLFQNAIYALTPTPETPDTLLASFGEGLTKLGARVIRLSPEVHDRVAAAVSHLPQVLALALVEFVGQRNAEEPAYLQMAAGGFRDMTRIASSPYAVWRDILATNRQEVREAIRAFREHLAAMERALESDEIEAHFAEANRIRAAIPRDAKGFLTPLCEVLVRCEDKPGVLARMTGALAGANINIMDIELLKVREGEGGTFRMAFKDDATAERAISVLCEAGFPARRR